MYLLIYRMCVAAAAAAGLRRGSIRSLALRCIFFQIK